MTDRDQLHFQELARLDTELAKAREGISRLTEQRDAALAECKLAHSRAWDAFDYLKHWTGDTQHLSNAEEIFIGNLDKDGKRTALAHAANEPKSNG